MQATAAVDAQLIDRQPRQRLYAGHEHPARFQPEAVLELVRREIRSLGEIRHRVPPSDVG